MKHSIYVVIALGATICLPREAFASVIDVAYSVYVSAETFPYTRPYLVDYQSASESHLPQHSLISATVFNASAIGFPSSTTAFQTSTCCSGVSVFCAMARACLSLAGRIAVWIPLVSKLFTTSAARISLFTLSRFRFHRFLQYSSNVV